MFIFQGFGQNLSDELKDVEIDFSENDYHVLNAPKVKKTSFIRESSNGNVLWNATESFLFTLLLQIFEVLIDKP